jgi:hypothetical protein
LKEIDPDCNECEYKDVCDETVELRRMRKAHEKNDGAKEHG